MKIHSMILIVQLKLSAVIKIKVSDLYKRVINIKSLSIYNEKDNFNIGEAEIERIISKKIIKEKNSLFA